ncbi:MAG: PASTA domain-containing protein [Bacteroidales bacterium]|nr:PASTA domain-containing protein [Bacteroidales bacterium]
MTGKEFLGKIFSPIIWLNLLAMVVVVGLISLLTVWWMNSYTRHGEGVEVPNVKGKLISDAEIELKELDLEGIVIDSSYNKRLAPGLIIDQTPGPGVHVKPGRQIYITINAKSEPTLPIPNIIDNCSMREAEAKLMALGFKVGPCQYIEGQKDWVFGVKCRGRNVAIGERVPLSVPITLVVGNSEVEVDENGNTYEENWFNETEEGDVPIGGTGVEEDNDQSEVLEF